MPTSLVTIMVPLLDEGIDVWRQVQAEVLSGGRYRIVSTNADPEDEHWAFATGELVLCEERPFEGENCLEAVSVAVQQAAAAGELRGRRGTLRRNVSAARG